MMRTEPARRFPFQISGTDDPDWRVYGRDGDAPIRLGDRHRPTFAAAVALATVRALRTGRRQHVGRVRSGVARGNWVVQEVR